MNEIFEMEFLHHLIALPRRIGHNIVVGHSLQFWKNIAELRDKHIIAGGIKFARLEIYGLRKCIGFVCNHYIN